MISIIAAVSKNGVIGKDQMLPWKLSTDLKHFASLTKGHIVIMGRKTYESILSRLGKPLPDRISIVLTRDVDYKVAEGVLVSHSFEDVRRIIPQEGEIFVIGGESVYKDAFPTADKLYLTEVAVEVDGDAFFPEWNKDEWKLELDEPHSKDEKNEYDFRFLEYVRKS